MAKYREILRLSNLGLSLTAAVSQKTGNRVLRLLLKPPKTEQRDIFELLYRKQKKSSAIFCSQCEYPDWYK